MTRIRRLRICRTRSTTSPGTFSATCGSARRSTCLSVRTTGTRLAWLFFFSSRRRHTRCSRDWSSDVCSSDLERDPVVSLLTPMLILGVPLFDIAFVGIVRVVTGKVHSLHEWLAYTGKDHMHHRSEERRVGKEGRSRWSPDH